MNGHLCQLNTTNIITKDHPLINADFKCCSTDKEDNAEVCTKLSQMNITNLLKSWGSKIASVLKACNMSHQVYTNETNEKSTRDGLLDKQLS
jgi:hypothetical protein